MLTSHADFWLWHSHHCHHSHGLTLFSIPPLQKVDAIPTLQGKPSRIAFSAYSERVKGTHRISLKLHTHLYSTYLTYLTYGILHMSCACQGVPKHLSRGLLLYTPKVTRNLPQVLPARLDSLAGISNSVSPWSCIPFPLQYLFHGNSHPLAGPYRTLATSPPMSQAALAPRSPSR